MWSDVTHLTFREVMLGDADIMLKFAHGYHSDGYPFDGPGKEFYFFYVKFYENAQM